MKKVLRYACLAAGITLFGATAYLYTSFYHMPKFVRVTDNNYHKDNDNNLLLLQGKIAAKEEVTDKKLKVSFKTPIMQRKVEMLQYYLEDDKVKAGWKDKAVPSFKDKTGKEWSNPPFYKTHTTNTFFHDFYLDKGDLPISSVYLKDDFDMTKYADKFGVIARLPKESTPAGFEYKRNFYVQRTTAPNNIGSVRIYYKVLNLAKPMPEFTIVGSQYNKKVNKSNHYARFYDKRMEPEEMRSSYTEDRFDAALGTFLLGICFTLVGLFKAKE
ncbi:MAG: hypothetical protein Q4D21_00285 [Phascolarctobacterium sp.]|nr:hypothetical protein [Phascolarctobacterium sp.]